VLICKQNNLSSGFQGALESKRKLHYYLENKFDVDLTVSHPHRAFTDHLAARLLSSLPYNLGGNGLLILVY